MKYIIKTIPYARTRRGRLEHVSGYADWRREQDKANIAKWKEVKGEPKGYPPGILGDRVGTPEEQAAHKERESREELRALLHKGENMKYVILEKAQVKPYVRTRRGKFERVGGYERARLDEARYDAILREERAEEEAEDYIDRELIEPSPTVVPGSIRDKRLAHNEKIRKENKAKLTEREGKPNLLVARAERARKKSQENLTHLSLALLQNLLGDRDPDTKEFQEDVKAEIARREGVSRTVVPGSTGIGVPDDFTVGAKEVAMTILDQMGGVGRLKAMTGAKNFMYFDEKGVKGVSFDFPNRGNKPNHIKITLDEASDTYNIEFGKKRAISWKRMARMHEEGKETSMSDFYKVTSTHTDIYNDALQDVFEHYTGLYLRLHKSVIIEKARTMGARDIRPRKRKEIDVAADEGKIKELTSKRWAFLKEHGGIDNILKDKDTLIAFQTLSNDLFKERSKRDLHNLHKARTTGAKDLKKRKSGFPGYHGDRELWDKEEDKEIAPFKKSRTAGAKDKKPRKKGYIRIEDVDPRYPTVHTGKYKWVKPPKVEKVGHEKLINWPKKETAMGTKDYLD